MGIRGDVVNGLKRDVEKAAILKRAPGRFRKNDKVGLVLRGLGRQVKVTGQDKRVRRAVGRRAA